MRFFKTAAKLRMEFGGLCKLCFRAQAAGAVCT